MKKPIDNLVPDINSVLRNAIAGNGTEIDPKLIADLGVAVASKVHRALNRNRKRERPSKTLYMSEVGKPCHRQVWYDHHMPEKSEPLLPHNAVKFLYGDILEELVLFLVKQAGHEVTGEQDAHEVQLGDGWVLRGKQDAIIDGVMVDVKSASPYSFKKFEEGLTDENDSFGYRHQLSAYRVANIDDPTKPSVDGQAFLVIDKQNGSIALSHSKPVMVGPKIAKLIRDLEQPEPPARAFDATPEGTSGNMKLPVNCSYCAYKMECWKDSNSGFGLRGFAYGRGPVFLTTVVREPKVPEIDLNKWDLFTESQETTSEA